MLSSFSCDYWPFVYSLLFLLCVENLRRPFEDLWSSLFIQLFLLIGAPSWELEALWSPCTVSSVSSVWGECRTLLGSSLCTASWKFSQGSKLGWLWGSARLVFACQAGSIVLCCLIIVLHTFVSYISPNILVGSHERVNLVLLLGPMWNPFIFKMEKIRLRICQIQINSAEIPMNNSCRLSMYHHHLGCQTFVLWHSTGWTLQSLMLVRGCIINWFTLSGVVDIDYYSPGSGELSKWNLNLFYDYWQELKNSQ